MKKLRFTVQVVVLVLAFPTWFYAEMKQADKAIQNAKQNSIKMINTQKTTAAKEEVETIQINTMGIPFSKHLVVSN
ncbi:MAG: hypothetical protein WBP16_06570 [Ferruginibacter sp.]